MKAWVERPVTRLRPNLTRHWAFLEEVGHCFKITLTERVEVVIRPLSEQQPIHSPDYVLKHKPSENFTTGRHPYLPYRL
jgi:hypothetical protein